MSSGGGGRPGASSALEESCKPPVRSPAFVSPSAKEGLDDVPSNVLLGLKSLYLFPY